jgi:hypothetical protein
MRMTVRMTSPSTSDRAASGVESAGARDERVIVLIRVPIGTGAVKLYFS